MEVMFGTPTYDKSVSIDYVTTMVATSRELTSRGVAFSSHFIAGNCFIDLARNSIVEHFLKHTTADCLFFVDADVGWSVDGVIRLLEHPAEVVAGLVPKRDDEQTYHHNALTGNVENNWLESLEAPTAFMRIKRSAFEKLNVAYPEYAQQTPKTLNKCTPYFQTGFYKDGWVGEDIFFCRQWAALGNSIWIYPDIEFSHRGSKGWRGNFYKYGTEQGMFKIG